MLKRKSSQAVKSLIAGSLLAIAAISTSYAQLPKEMEVWKDPTCGCCNDWITYMKNNGYTVKLNNSGNTQMRASLGVSRQFASCHTATIGGYVVEGHVPLEDIERMLTEKPNAIGIAAPGMPVGSPGMDGPAYGGRQDAYNVIIIDKAGAGSVYHAY